MENQIDELYLDIDVKMRKGIEDRIALLAKSLEKVNKAIKDSGNLKNLQEYVRNLNLIGRARKKAQSKSSSEGKARTPQTEEVDTPQSDKPKDTTKNTTAETASAYRDINEEIARVTRSTKTLKDGTQQQIEVFTEVEGKTKRVTKKINGLIVSQKEMEVQSGKSNKTFAKLVRSVGRIAFYRAVRTGFKFITDSIKEGITNIREFDEDTNRAFSQMSVSVTTINNSFASLFAGLAQSLAPLVTKIADGIANITNRINESQAVLKGESTYMKVLTSDTKEWKEQVEKATGKLLEFDNFLALNNEEKKYTGLIEGKTGMSEEEAKNIQGSINGIISLVSLLGTTLLTVKAIDFFGSLKGKFEGLKNIVDSVHISVKNGVSNFKNLDKVTQGLAIGGIAMLAGGIVALIANWKDMGNTARWLVPILSVLVGVVTALVVGLTIAKGNWLRAISIGAMVTGVGLTVGSTLSAQKYADGGMVEKGTTFIAGEAGAEAVHTSARGTGVTNIEQFTQAMLNALNVYGVARGSDVNFKGDVYINGTKAGQLIEGSVYREGVRVGHFNKG